MHPKVCLCATACKPQYWIPLYNSIGRNDIEFELVFVGPNPPGYELPKNFRFIKTDVKPAQCFEIATRNTSADFILHIADDFEFTTPNPLDKLYDTYKSFNQENIIVTTKYMQNNVVLPISVYKFFSQYNSDLVIPINSFMSRKLYRELKGIDKNFEAIFWEIDIAMRVYALGGKVVISDVSVNEDKTGEAGKDFWGRTALKDRLLLESLWVSNGKVHLNRKNPVEPFVDLNILKASQGPRGRWRGNGIKLFEKIEDSLNSQWSVPGRIYRAIKRPRMYFNYAKRIALSVRKKVLLQK